MMGNTPGFLLRGRQISSVQTGVGSVAAGVSDPRDPSAGGRGTVIRSTSRPSALAELKGGFTDVMHGRVSLVMLEFMILLAIGFYLWTYRAQGGG